MSIGNDILTAIQTNLRNTTHFFSSNIYKRAEKADDRVSPNGIDFFIHLPPVEPSETPFNLDHRKYPVEIVLRFHEEERSAALDADDRDVIVERMNNLIENFLYEMRYGQVTVTNIYHHEWVDTELDPSVDFDSEQTGLHRIKFTYNFWGFIDTADEPIEGGSGTADDQTSDVIDGGAGADSSYPTALDGDIP